MAVLRSFAPSQAQISHYQAPENHADLASFRAPNVSTFNLYHYAFPILFKMPRPLRPFKGVRESNAETPHDLSFLPAGPYLDGLINYKFLSCLLIQSFLACNQYSLQYQFIPFTTCLARTSISKRMME